eukprot:767835-Hanusia_phi.AAC.8
METSRYSTSSFSCSYIHQRRHRDMECNDIQAFTPEAASVILSYSKGKQPSPLAEGLGRKRAVCKQVNRRNV